MGVGGWKGRKPASLQPPPKEVSCCRNLRWRGMRACLAASDPAPFSPHPRSAGHFYARQLKFQSLPYLGTGSLLRRLRATPVETSGFGTPLPTVPWALRPGRVLRLGRPRSRAGEQVNASLQVLAGVRRAPAHGAVLLSRRLSSWGFKAPGKQGLVLTLGPQETDGRMISSCFQGSLQGGKSPGLGATRPL